MKKLLVFSLFMLTMPVMVNAQAWTLPSGKTFAEFTTPTGITVWAEVLGAIVVKADELSQEQQIKRFITTWAEWNEVDSRFMLDLARCESGFNPVAKGDYIRGVPRAYGLYQWWQKSWNKYNDIFNTDLERTDWRDQVRMTSKVLKDYGSDDWFNCSFFIENGHWPKK